MPPGLPEKTLFPKDWGQERIMHHISDMATDLKIPWVQVSQKTTLPRFVAEGFRSDLGHEVNIRVVLEPGGQGIVTGYPVKMSFAERVRNVVVSMKDVFQLEDWNFIQSLLRHDMVVLALEVLCDQLLDQKSCLSEKEGREIQELANESNLMPEYSWEFLLVYDQQLGIPKKLLREQDDSIETSILTIIDDMKDCVDEKRLSLLREFLEAGEIVLCIETLFDLIIAGQVKLSEPSYITMIDLATACQFGQDDIKKLKIREESKCAFNT